MSLAPADVPPAASATTAAGVAGFVLARISPTVDAIAGDGSGLRQTDGLAPALAPPAPEVGIANFVLAATQTASASTAAGVAGLAPARRSPTADALAGDGSGFRQMPVQLFA